MANLFWKTKAGITSLLATPFKSEEEFEKIVFETQELLEDIFPLKRQVRGGSKVGIPDIIGIDNDGNICIVEMKNITVDASIIPQVLQYAFWAETNPDSIKSLWLECHNKPENIDISWDSVQIRIIVMAPSILRSTLDIVDKINYPVDLIEVKRWVDGDNQLLLVNQLERENTKKIIRPVVGLQTYDDDFYRKQYNSDSAEHFIKIVREIDDYVKRKEWGLELKYNKHYCSFKAGFYIAFGVKWVGSKTFAMFFKIPQKLSAELEPKLTRYEAEWKEAVYYVTPGKTKISDYESIFEAAYKHIAGK